MSHPIVERLCNQLNARWRIDVAKVYLIAALAFIFVSGKTLYYSYAAPPLEALTTVTGALSVEKMRRGYLLTVTTPEGMAHRFTCSRGNDVYCSNPKLPSKTESVTAKFSAQRPELLLELSSGGQPALSYQRLSAQYRFAGLELYMFFTGALLLALFIVSPKIHKPQKHESTQVG